MHGILKLLLKLPFFVEKTFSKSTTIGNPQEQAEWGQELGYNQSFPKLGNGQNAFAGCGPVACGQIMYYFKHPSNINWNGMNRSGYGNKTTSSFLFQIAEKANCDYREDGTYTTLSKIENVLKSFGYTTKKGSSVVIGKTGRQCVFNCSIITIVSSVPSPVDII